MQGFMGENAIASTEGSIFIVKGSQNFVISQAINLETNLEFNKVDLRAIGRRVVGQKPTSANLTGTLGLRETSSEIKKWGIEYIRTGKIPYFNIQSSVEDKATDFGREVIVYSGCLFDSIALSRLAADDAVIEYDLGFTIEDVELLEEFTQRMQGVL